MTTQDRTIDPETLLRFHRRSMIFLLLMITALGAFLTASALWPEAGLLRWVERAPFFFPMMIIIAVAAQQTSMRRHRIALDTPEFKALMSDEWRLKSMDRASRGALIIVLVAQFLLPLVFADLPTIRAVWGMAAATVTVGAAAQIGLFLLFDRD
jgi:hypothetical protein